MGVTGRSLLKRQLAASNQKHTEVILASLITSKTRLKLLLKFFTHPDAQGHLRGLAEEFGDSTNSVRIELNKLEEAGLLQRQVSGRKMLYQVNKSNPFYFNLVSMVSKYLGFDELVESLLEQVGDLKEAYVVGDYARGVDSGTIELILVGQLHAEVVDDLVARVSKRINRRITYRLSETENELVPQPQLRLL
jgi:DNA-binding MarR family transcriptional regulator